MKPGVLALIPARGGSKGILRKNLQPVAGKPLVLWTCEVARHAPSITRLIVSTEDPEIAEVARRGGAEIPFLRPAELAADETPAIDVILHCLGWLQANEGVLPDLLLWLQPTSPLRTVNDIEGAVNLLHTRKAASVVSVSPSSHPAAWLKRVSEEGLLLPWQTGSSPSRRQEVEKSFELNGAIYLTRTEHLLREKSLYSDPTYAFVMPRERSLDIDEPWDLKLADLILRDEHH